MSVDETGDATALIPPDEVVAHEPTSEGSERTRRDGPTSCDSDVASSSGADLEELLSELESSERFSIRHLFNMC